MSVFAKLLARFGPPDQAARDARQIRKLRARGVRIGEGCRIYTKDFSTEPWLVTIGDRVGIAGGVKFLPHDGSAMLVRHRRPEAQKLGPISVGSDVFIGENALILANAEIGAGSIIGPGSVVMGTIPPNTLVFGNPAQVVGRASLYLERLLHDSDTLDTFSQPPERRMATILEHFGLEVGGVPAED